MQEYEHIQYSKITSLKKQIYHAKGCAMKYVFILIFSFTVSSAAIADTYLFVGTTFPLILEKNFKGEIGGLGYDIAKKIALKLGHDIKVEIYPFKRALKMVEQGEADVFIGPYKSTEREKFMRFNKYAFYQDPMVFYVKVDSDFQWNNDLSSLKGKRIGLTRGWSYGTRFDQYKPNLDIETASTVKANFQKLLAGRIDLLISHPRSALQFIDTLRITDDVKMIIPPISINKGYYGFSKNKKMDNFLIQFDLEFNKMIDSGEIHQLSRQYNLNFSSINQGKQLQ